MCELEYVLVSPVFLEGLSQPDLQMSLAFLACLLANGNEQTCRSLYRRKVDTTCSVLLHLAYLIYHCIITIISHIYNLIKYTRLNILNLNLQTTPNNELTESNSLTHQSKPDYHRPNQTNKGLGSSSR